VKDKFLTKEFIRFASITPKFDFAGIGSMED